MLNSSHVLTTFLYLQYNFCCVRRCESWRGYGSPDAKSYVRRVSRLIETIT